LTLPSCDSASRSVAVWTTRASGGGFPAWRRRSAGWKTSGDGRIIDQYAVNQITVEAYIAANRDLDRQQEQLSRKKAELIAGMRSPQEDFVDASIRQFCATGNARLRTCTDFDTKRQFLRDHVERVIFNGYRITILGSLPVRSITGETTLQFRGWDGDRRRSLEAPPRPRNQGNRVKEIMLR
jgi:hypothetical protein